MKFISILLAMLGLTAAFLPAASADPQSDRKEFQGYFKSKFPGVSDAEFSNGFYGLPMFKEYRENWEANNELPGYELGLDSGKAFWNKKFANGESFENCVKNGIIHPATKYPRWDKAKKQIRTVELDINACLKANGEKEFTDLDKDGKARGALAEVTAFYYSRFRGQKMQPDVDFTDADALAAYERGRKLWWTRRGQLNFACSHCHVDLPGKNIGGNQPLSAGLGHTTAWPAQRLVWGKLETLHWRYATCNSQVRAKPFKQNGDEYLTLQLYESFLSSGLPLTAPAMRN